MKKIVAFAALSLALAACTAPKPNEVPVTTAPVTQKGFYMFVMNGLGKTIDRVNLKTREVTLGVLKTGEVPNQLFTVGESTYLVNAQDATIDVLDLKGGSKKDTMVLRVGSWPQWLAFGADGKGVVAHYNAFGSKELAWMDFGAKTLEATASAAELAWTSTGCVIANGKVYAPAKVAEWGQPSTSSGCYVFDYATHALLKTISLEATDDPTEISLSPNGKVELGVNTGVVVIDPATDAVVKRLDFKTPVTTMRYASATKAYATTEKGLVSYNPTTYEILRDKDHAIASVASMFGSFRIFNNAAYIPNMASNSIQVIDLLTETASGSDIPVGSGPQDVAFVTVDE
ncbi:hypothetical protein J7643_06130 [bacterium]|nr:hypothetical protein [bacterium]